MPASFHANAQLRRPLSPSCLPVRPREEQSDEMGPGVYDPEAIQKEARAARAAFKSTTSRDGYGSIYKVDESGPKRATRNTRRTPLHEVN